VSDKEKSLYNKALEYIEEEKYEFAEKNFIQLLSIDSTRFNYWYELGLLYAHQMENIVKAIPCFKGAIRHINKEADENVYLYLAQAFQFVQEYDEAIRLFREYEKLPLKEGFIKVSVTPYIELCEYARNTETKMKRKSAYQLVNLGANINSSYSEYASVPLFRNNSLLFTSRRTSVTDSLMMIFDQYYEYMYISEKKEGGLNSQEGTFTKAVNFISYPEFVKFGKKTSYHKAVIGIYPDYSKLLVYQKQRIWTSENKDGVWQKPKKMSKAINFAEYMRHASVTADGKTMYLSASFSGEADNIDIYVSHLQENGKWSKAQNLGPVINTQGNEDSPEISPDGKVLYFSSAGHQGMGNFDVFRSELVNGEWTTPVNLGYPINSPADDIFFKWDPNTGVAYFSSSRAEGYGKMDLYAAFPIDTAPDFSKCISSKKEMSRYVFFDWFINDTVTAGEKVILEARILQLQSVSDIAFFWRVDNKTVYEGIRDTHIFVNPGKHTITLMMRAWNDSTEKQMTFCVEKEILVITREEMAVLKNDQKKSKELMPVFFDYDKFNIRDSEVKTLQENIAYLKENTDVKVRIYAHTDSRGSDYYNKVLSQKRADAVVKYLLKNGISRKRITESVGMGESKLFNKCADGVECTEEEHQVNRRAVFVPE
jgi:outer membrane protein OmpA-like peptidoglycan-associated protein/tetratricopeptide (TPR) repeat protein